MRVLNAKQALEAYNAGAIQYCVEDNQVHMNEPSFVSNYYRSGGIWAYSFFGFEEEPTKEDFEFLFMGGE